MELQYCKMNAFSVIGKEGDTRAGADTVQKLWADANARFHEVEPLAARDENGNLLGIWGLMSDVSRAFRPWEDGFTKGLYLAGVQCRPDAQASEGWTKWTAPASEYAYAQNDGPDAFIRGLEALESAGHALIGAAYDYTCPQTGKGYTFYPIRRLARGENA